MNTAYVLCGIGLAILTVLSMILRNIVKTVTEWAVLNERVKVVQKDIDEIKSWIKEVVKGALSN